MLAMRWSQLPNLITGVRMLLVLPAGWLLWLGRYPEALVVVGVAGASDALDGELARRFGWRSAFGSMMDPIADKLLVLAIFVIFTFQGHIPLWVAVVVIGRDMVILAGAGIYRLMFGSIEMAPTLGADPGQQGQHGDTDPDAVAAVAGAMRVRGAERGGAPNRGSWSFWVLAVFGSRFRARLCGYLEPESVAQPVATEPLKTAAFTGGGTAGHVLRPSRSCAGFSSAVSKSSISAAPGGLEKRYLEGVADVQFFGIASGKLRRYWSWRNLTDVIGVLRGIWQSLRLLGRVRPGVIFSKGGHLSFPVVLAGWLRGIPIVAHESDFSPGLANRLAMPFLHTLCTSFPMQRPRRLRGELVHTGSPVRPELLAGSRGRKDGRLLRAPSGHPVVLVTGGSLGADA